MIHSVARQHMFYQFIYLFFVSDLSFISIVHLTHLVQLEITYFEMLLLSLSAQSSGISEAFYGF